MTNTLRKSIDDLAANFATAIVSAIRRGNLDDILALAEGALEAAPRRGPGRPRGKVAALVKATPTKAPAALPARDAKGRLHRRSPQEIAKALGKVVTLLKSTKAGLRAEQIRKKLGMQANEMPRVLKEGLAKKALKSKGQKRSTTYTAV
jgi:hypothetical protein